MVKLESICSKDRHVRKVAVSYSHDAYATREIADAKTKAKAELYQKAGYPNSFLLERSAEEPHDEQRALMPLYKDVRLSDFLTMHTLLAEGVEASSFVGPPATLTRGRVIEQTLKDFGSISKEKRAIFTDEGTYDELSLERSMRMAMEPFDLKGKESVIWTNGDIPMFFDQVPVIWDKDLDRYYSILDWNVKENLKDPEVLDRRFHHKLAQDKGLASFILNIIEAARGAKPEGPVFDHFKEPNTQVIGQFHTERPYRLVNAIYPNRKQGSINEGEMAGMVMKIFSIYDLVKTVLAAVTLSPYATARFSAKTFAKMHKTHSDNLHYTWKDMNYLFNAALGGSVLCKGGHDDWTRVLDCDQWGDILKYRAIFDYLAAKPEEAAQLYPYTDELEAVNEALAPLDETGPLSPSNFRDYANQRAQELSDPDKQVLMARPFDAAGNVTEDYMTQEMLGRFINLLGNYKSDFDHNNRLLQETRGIR